VKTRVPMIEESNLVQFQSIVSLLREVQYGFFCAIQCCTPSKKGWSMIVTDEKETTLETKGMGWCHKGGFY
jgi:hypothetical protein